MAVRFDETVGKRLYRTTDLLNYNAAYTVAFWGYPISLGSSDTTFSTMGSSISSAGVDLCQLFLGSGRVGLYIHNGSSDAGAAGAVVTMNTWYRIWIVRASATSIVFYLNGTGTSPITLDVSGRGASAAMGLGNTYYSGSWIGEEIDARMANVKIWSAALSVAELKTEDRSMRPRRIANLYGWWPIFPGSGERVRDYGASGRDWTEGGTLTDEAGPPVPWGFSTVWQIPLPSGVPPAGRTTKNTDPYGLGIAPGISRTIKIGGL